MQILKYILTIILICFFFNGYSQRKRTYIGDKTYTGNLIITGSTTSQAINTNELNASNIHTDNCIRYTVVKEIQDPKEGEVITYVTDKYFIIQYNNRGSMTFRYIDLLVENARWLFSNKKPE